MATALAVPGVEAASKTLYVGTYKGPSPYATIQSTVDAVNDDGFTIYVCPGTYNENVQVQNKEDVTIRNYVIKNQPAPLVNPNGNDGFAISTSEEVEIRGLRITNAHAGISTTNSPETEVRNTSSTASEVGIYFYGTTRGNVRKNTSSFGQYGVIMLTSNSNTVTENTAKNNTQAGVYVESDATMNTKRICCKATAPMQSIIRRAARPLAQPIRGQITGATRASQMTYVAVTRPNDVRHHRRQLCRLCLCRTRS